MAQLAVVTPKCAQSETQFDVDLIILDYLLYMATKALLEEQAQVTRYEQGTTEHLSHLPLQMVDSFLRVFKCQHPNDSVPEAIRFRLRLLKFTALYGHRWTSDTTVPSPAELQALRRTHRRRAEEWLDSVPDPPVFPILNFNPPDRKGRSPTSSHDYAESIALSDLVPMFLSLSSARGELQDGGFGSITQQWMELAAEFMLQAALEQCIVHGTDSSAKLREIFAWGWTSIPLQTGWEDATSVNQMFREEDLQQEVSGWSEIRKEFIEMLAPPHDVPLLAHLQNICTRLPMDRFEKKIFDFTEALQQSQELPVLAQLEAGHVTGLTAFETEALKHRLGLSRLNHQ